MPRNKPHSEETKRKIGLANRNRIVIKCANCEKDVEVQPSKAKRYNRMFCNGKCYSEFRKTKLPFNEQHAYKGIFKERPPKWFYSARYRKKNPERVSHLKARRYAREKGAIGSHTLEEWQELCKKFDYKCAKCGEKRKLTKDHIKPLAEKGTDYIANIQPLCRSCNSRKWKTYT